MVTTKRILLYVIPIVMLGACSKSEDKSQSENNGTSILVVSKIVEIDYPGGAYTRDDQYYTYDNDRIASCTYSSYGTKAIFKYPSDDIIEREQIEDFTWHKTQYRMSYILSKDRLKYVIRETHFENKNRLSSELKRDSIVFVYEGEYLSKRIEYSKGDVSSFTHFKDYIKTEEIVLTWENDNIINMKFYETNVITRLTYEQETLYQYDEKPYIEYGELAYETPFDQITKGISALVLHGKLGKWNKNNVVSMTNKMSSLGFKTITYDDRVVVGGKLVKILMNGENYKGEKYEKMPVIITYQ